MFLQKGPESAGSEPQSQNIVNSNPDYTYSMLDAFVPLPGDDNAQCRCKRGAQVKVHSNLSHENFI